MTAFAELLRHYRARAGLTQEALAERAGLTASGISALERGARRLPYVYTRRQLAEALELSDEERTRFVAPRPPLPPTAGMAPAPLAQPAGTLPAPRTPLVGRARELAALRDLMLSNSVHLVTVTGVGGSGKTRLAVQIAADVRERFPGGVWFVELAAVTDPALVPQIVASILGLPDGPDAPLVDGLPVWLRSLRSQRVLLVLDNCEQVVDACAKLAEQLLSVCPSLTILATSREPLQITGEHRWRLSPLAVPEPDHGASTDELAAYPALQLFLARAQAVSPDFRLTDNNAATVAEVCARLEGIPLALELAAVRVAVLTVEQILARLDDAIRLLTGGSRGAPSRQQTVRGALDWSHDLLTGPEKILFRRLAVFAGGGDLEAIEAIGAGQTPPDGEVLDLLGRLVNKSLVQVEQDGRASRYRLLEPVRQYAVRHLTESGETDFTRARHAAWYLALVERAAPELHGRSQIAWLERLEREQDNLRAALRRAEEFNDSEPGLRLAVALVPFWEGHSHLSEGRRWLSTMLAMTPASCGKTLRMKALIGAGSLAQWQAELEQSESLFSESLTLARALDDQKGIADPLSGLGTVARRQGSYARSVRLLGESLALHQLLQDEPGIAFALLSLGVTLANQDDHAHARTLLEECLRRYRQLGDLRLVAIALTMLALVVGAQGDLRQASALLHEGLTGHVEVGDRAFVVFALTGLAGVAATARQSVQAARLLGAADMLRDSVGAFLAPINRVSLAKTEARIQAQLSERDTAAARETGRAFSLEEVLAEAATVASLDAPSPPAVSSAPGRSHPALTRREAEVARLLEDGRSDREIAQALAISVRTVGIHVQHLLAKLDVRSRWQVTIDGRPPSA